MRSKLISAAVFLSACNPMSCAHLGSGGSAAGDCPSGMRLKADVPNELWVLESSENTLRDDGWCMHYMFKHISRSARIGIGILPWSEGAPAMAQEHAKKLTEYDNHTGEGDIMDRDESEDGESWAFLYVLKRSEDSNDLYFMSFLKDPQRPDMIIVVTGMWPQNDNIGLLHQLTLFTEHIDILVEE